MALKVFQRKIDDTTITGGTGDLVCDGPAGAGNQGLFYVGQVAGNGDQLVLCFSDLAGNFEVSNCTVSISGTTVTLTRDSVVSSSNSGAKVNFGTSIVNIHNYLPQTLELYLFNLAFQTQAQGALAAIASDVSDMKDALSILLNG